MEMQMFYLEITELEVSGTVQELRRNKSLEILLQVKLQLQHHRSDPWSDEGSRYAQLENPYVRPIIELKESSSIRFIWHLHFHFQSRY